MFVLHESWTPYSSLVKERSNIRAHDVKRSHMWKKNFSENRCEKILGKRGVVVKTNKHGVVDGASNCKTLFDEMI